MNKAGIINRTFPKAGVSGKEASRIAGIVGELDIRDLVDLYFQAEEMRTKQLVRPTGK